MKFSICIPNFNYAHYLGKTLQSVLTQSHADFEIWLSDNASTDQSVALANGLGDPRIQCHVNRRNVGFAGNLDRAAAHATGERIIMLSSDDLMLPGALEAYQKLRTALGNAAERAVFSSDCTIIDGDDQQTGTLQMDASLWKETRHHADLSAAVGAEVVSMDAGALLRASLLQLKNPLSFLATCYPRELYLAVEGYGGSRQFVPDKTFHWKLLSAADRAYLIRIPLFAYRVHTSNQTSQETGLGALKLMIDQYAATFDLDNETMQRAGLNRNDLTDAFVEFDIGRHGLATLARGERTKARRIHTFGKAAYPLQTKRNRKARILSVLLAAGPLGTWIAKRAYAKHLASRESSNHLESR
jgi:glycosyltransferase involved in cell wall biosynthesis